MARSWRWLLLVGLVDACVMPPAYEPQHRDSRAARLPSPPPRSRAPRTFYPSLRTKLLPSGLLVALEEDPYARVVGVVSVVRGGFAADPPGAQGLAHLVEHLTFRAIDTEVEPLPLAEGGAKRNPRPTRRERLVYYAAGQVNCQTTPDAMTCYEFGQPSRLPWLVALEGARLANPLAGVEATAFALERRVIANEGEYRDDPRAGMWAVRQVFPLLFPAGHPYARRLDGPANRVEQVTLADARAFVAKNFRPERMTLLVTAPTATTNLDAIIKRLPKSLIEAPAQPATRPAEPETPHAFDKPAGPLVRRSSPLPVPQIWLGYTLPGWWGPQGPAEHLLVRWIAQDMNLDELRQEDPHIRHVQASVAPGLAASALLVRVLIDDGADADHVVQVVAGRLASMWTREPTQRPMLALLKDALLTALALNEPTQAERAIEQTELLAASSKPVLQANRMTAAAELPTPDLAKLAYDYLGQQRRHAVLFSPAEAPSPAQGNRVTPPRQQAEDLFADAATWLTTELPDTVAGASGLVVKKLSTGLTVVVARRRSAATVAWLGFRGGYSDASSPLLAALALRLRPDAFDHVQDCRAPRRRRQAKRLKEEAQRPSTRRNPRGVTTCTTWCPDTRSTFSGRRSRLSSVTR